MSTNLYSTVLVWAGARGGVAKLHGRQVKLIAAPTIAGLRIANETNPLTARVAEGAVQLVWAVTATPVYLAPRGRACDE